jgi:hypothetical protein
MKGKFRILNTTGNTYILVPESQALYLESLLYTTYKGCNNVITHEIKRMTSNKTVAEVDMGKWSSKMGQIFTHVAEDDSDLIQTTARALNGEKPDLTERKKAADEFVKDVVGDIFGKVTYDKSGPVETSVKPRKINKPAVNRSMFSNDDSSSEESESDDDEVEEINKDEPILAMVPRARTPSPPPAPLAPPAPAPPVPPRPTKLPKLNRKEIAKVAIKENGKLNDAMQGGGEAFAMFVAAIEETGTVEEEFSTNKYKVIVDWGRFFSMVILYIGMLGVVQTLYKLSIGEKDPMDIVDILSYDYFPDIGTYKTEVGEFVKWRYEISESEESLKNDIRNYKEKLEMELVIKELWYSDSSEFMETIAVSQTAVEPLKDLAKRLWSSSDEDFVFDSISSLPKDSQNAIALNGAGYEEVKTLLTHMESMDFGDSPMQSIKETTVATLNAQYSTFTNYLSDTGKYSNKYYLDTKRTNKGKKPVMLNWAKLYRYYENSSFSIISDFRSILSTVYKYANLGAAKWTRLVNSPLAKFFGDISDVISFQESQEFRRELYKGFLVMALLFTPAMTEVVTGSYGLLKLYKLKSARMAFYKDLKWNLLDGTMKMCDVFLLTNVLITSYSSLALLNIVDKEGEVHNHNVALGDGDLTTYYSCALTQLYFSNLLRKRILPFENKVSDLKEVVATATALYVLTIELDPNVAATNLLGQLKMYTPFALMGMSAINVFFKLVVLANNFRVGYYGMKYRLKRQKELAQIKEVD